MTNNLEGYFQTRGQVILPGVGVAMRLPQDVWYRNVGAVSSLAGNIAETELILRGSIELGRSRLQRLLEWPIDFCFREGLKEGVRQKSPNIDLLDAYCLAHKVRHSLTLAYVIAKNDDLSPSKSIFVDGQMSGKFLQAIGKEKVLFDAFERENVGRPTAYRSAGVPKYEGEDFSDAAGLFALLKATRSGIEDVQIPTFKNRLPIKPEQIKVFGL